MTGHGSQGQAKVLLALQKSCSSALCECDYVLGRDVLFLCAELEWTVAAVMVSQKRKGMLFQRKHKGKVGAYIAFVSSSQHTNNTKAKRPLKCIPTLNVHS